MTALEKSTRRLRMAMPRQRPDRHPVAPNDWQSLHDAVKELGGDGFAQRQPEPLQRRLVKRLEGLGCKVTFEPTLVAA